MGSIHEKMFKKSRDTAALEKIATFIHQEPEPKPEPKNGSAPQHCCNEPKLATNEWKRKNG